MKHAARWLRSFVVGLLAFAITLVLLDLYLNHAGIQSPMESRLDDELGPLYIPDVAFTRFSEGFFVGSANPWRCLGPGLPPQRVRGEARILLFGDSFVLGHTVLSRHHFGRTLERRLGEALGREVAALNFARADYCLWNMHQHLVDYGRRWDHDLVLLFVANQDLAPRGPADPAMYPFTYADGDSLAIDRGFRDSEKFAVYRRAEPVLTRFSLPRLGFNLLKVIDSGEWVGVVLEKFAPARAVAATGPAPLPRPLPPTSRLILRDLARDPRVVVVAREDLVPAYREAILAAGLPLVELAPLWDQLRAEGLDPFWWPVTGAHGHWNRATHRRLGEFLAERIVADGRL